MLGIFRTIGTDLATQGVSCESPYAPTRSEYPAEADWRRENVAKTLARRKPTKERKRPIDEAVAYAVGHRVRIEALAILAEGKHSPNEVAVILHEGLAMSTETRRDVIGVIVQAIMSELLGSFRAGKLETDDDVWLAWDAANLDLEGKREVADELAASFDRLLDIKARSANRLAESGETGTTTIVSLTGFERCREPQPTNGYGAPAEN